MSPFSDVDAPGRVLGERSVANHTDGHRDLIAWAQGLGRQRRFGLEVTGSYGAGLARRLLVAGEEVREVPATLTHREGRRTRRPGKSDPTDALAIALVTAREPKLPPVPVDGLAEELRILVDYRDQLLAERTREGYRIHADLCVLAPGYGQHVRNLSAARYRGRVRQLVRGNRSTRAQLVWARLARLTTIDAIAARLKAQLGARVQVACPTLLAVKGVGPITAAKLRGEAGDVLRFHSKGAFAMACGATPLPASSGQVQRHRLNRGGNRQLNRAPHTVALVQVRTDPRAQAYVTRKKTEGKTFREAVRCLKRDLANVVYGALCDDLMACPS